MEITLVVYKAVSKKVSIEFPLYYKSGYLGDNYQDESYVMVIENGTQITISKDSEGIQYSLSLKQLCTQLM